MANFVPIVKREFIERVRSKAFLIGTLLGPIIFLGLGAYFTYAFGHPEGMSRIAVLNGASGDLGQLVTRQLKNDKIDSTTYRYEVTLVNADGRLLATRDSLVAQVDRRTASGDQDPNSIRGIVVLTDSGVAAGRVSYLGSNAGSITSMAHLEDVLRNVITEARLQHFGVPDSVARLATTQFDLKTSKITKGKLTGEGGKAAFFLAYILVIVLFIAMLPTGVQVMSSVVEEKSNRILEVLLASVRPFDLLLGKVLGVGAASLLQLGIWAGSAMLVAGKFSAKSVPVTGTGTGGQMPATASGGFTMPNISPELVLVILIYFLIGFLLFAALYAAVGAMCNSVQETQQFQMPVTVVAMLGYFGAFGAINNPGSQLAKVLSYVPPTAPFVVPVRYAISPLPLPELLASITVSILGVLAVVWIAARIYRVGILSYGKKPTPREILRWIRAK